MAPVPTSGLCTRPRLSLDGLRAKTPCGESQGLFPLALSRGVVSVALEFFLGCLGEIPHNSLSWVALWEVRALVQPLRRTFFFCPLDFRNTFFLGTCPFCPDFLVYWHKGVRISLIF